MNCAFKERRGTLGEEKDGGEHNERSCEDEDRSELSGVNLAQLYILQIVKTEMNIRGCLGCFATLHNSTPNELEGRRRIP